MDQQAQEEQKDKKGAGIETVQSGEDHRKDGKRYSCGVNAAEERDRERLIDFSGRRKPALVELRHAVRATFSYTTLDGSKDILARQSLNPMKTEAPTTVPGTPDCLMPAASRTLL